MRETVVFLHGLWMPGHAMALLRRRIGHCGFDTAQYSYPAMRRTIFDNASGLEKFLSRVGGDVVHLVAHSLGGLVVRQLFESFPEQRPGRIVTLGTPHQGSEAARALARYRFGRRVLGASVRGCLDGELPGWHGQRQLGVIAGSLGLGMGRVVANMSGANDGAVSVEEARLPGAADYLELHLSHTALLLSSEVADQICAFLRQGRFER